LTYYDRLFNESNYYNYKVTRDFRYPLCHHFVSFASTRSKEMGRIKKSDIHQYQLGLTAV